MQRKNLILGEVASKFTKLKRSFDELKNKDGQLFRQHSQSFLLISNLLQTNEEEIDARTEEFNHIYKIPFLEAVILEHGLAFHLDNPILLAFESFNVTSDFDIKERNQVYYLKGILWSL